LTVQKKRRAGEGKKKKKKKRDPAENRLKSVPISSHLFAGCVLMKVMKWTEEKKGGKKKGKKKKRR